MATQAFPGIDHIQHRVSVDILDNAHRQTYDRALSNVLATDAALMTMAQLIDGLPLDEVARHASGQRLGRGHPIYDHKTLCEGVLERTVAFRDAFNSSIVTLPAQVCHVS